MISIIFVLFSQQVSALETGRAAIEQAQALALKKNRREACTVLRKAAENAGKNRGRILEQLNTLSKVFFTDKGQKAFEAGQGAMFENPDVALNHFRQSLELEDDNAVLLLNMARVSLMKQDCENAAGYVERARILNPYFGEAAVLEMSALNCLKKTEALREKAKSLPSLTKWEEGFVQYLLAQDLLRQGQAKRASEIWQRFSEENPQFPEVYFYLARSGQELQKDIEHWQQRYVSLCKGVTFQERKKFSLEPRLCAAVKEVEDELAKSASEI
jgi:tetratricopeptide (TPR) repeat protein